MPPGIAPLGLLIWAVACFALGLAGTLIARRYALRRQLIDQPGARRSHSVATPRGGGIAIVMVMSLAQVAVAVCVPSQRAVLVAATVGLLLVAGIGWIDDHRPLSARLRLLVHVAAAGLLATAVQSSTGSIVLALAAFMLAVGLVNAWNFMDGINGLAASQAAAVALGYALVATDPPSRWLCIALAAACLGFLPLNFPSARIFLGDVGSGALGYVLAVLVALVVVAGRQASAGEPAAAPMLLLVPLSAFLVDAGLTLARRILRRERWWTPHVQHAYQRWAAAARDHRRVTWAYLAWTCMGIIVMASTWNLDGTGIIAAVSAWYLGGGIVWIGLQSRHRMVNEEGRA